MMGVLSGLPVLPKKTLHWVAAAMIGGSALAYAMTPQHLTEASAPPLDRHTPAVFGAWKLVPSNIIQPELSVNERGEKSINQPYDQTVMRSYASTDGQHLVHLALAWGRTQRQEVKIHRPELCYPAQGLEVLSLAPTSFKGLSTSSEVVGKRMLSRGQGRLEAVVYWIRIGNVYSTGAWNTRMHILSEGLQGRIPDGILVRASESIPDERSAEAAYVRLESFLGELVANAPSDVRSVLVH